MLLTCRPMTCSVVHMFGTHDTEGNMRSEFVILTTSGLVKRIYEGTAAEQFAAYLAEFPIGSGANLRYTRSLETPTPLVRFS